MLIKYSGNVRLQLKDLNQGHKSEVLAAVRMYWDLQVSVLLTLETRDFNVSNCPSLRWQSKC